jgi:hypothetical protein
MGKSKELFEMIREQLRDDNDDYINYLVHNFNPKTLSNQNNGNVPPKRINTLKTSKNKN